MQMLMEPFAPWRRDLHRQLTRSTPAGFFPPPDAIDAAMHDGVLTVKMRKPGKSRPHRIDVRAEERQAEQVKGPESGPSEKQGAPA